MPPNLVYPTVATLRRGFAQKATNMAGLFASRTNDPRFNNLATLSPCRSIVNPAKEGRCPSHSEGRQPHQAYPTDEHNRLSLPDGLTAEGVKAQADRHARREGTGCLHFYYWPVWLAAENLDPDRSPGVPKVSSHAPGRLTGRRRRGASPSLHERQRWEAESSKGLA